MDQELRKDVGAVEQVLGKAWLKLSRSDGTSRRPATP